MNPSAPPSLVVGLTGSIGSGKSQAAEIFKECGAAILDADVLAREVVRPGSQGLAAIKAKFGAKYILPNGELDRRSLGELVFSKNELRMQLEDILHPRIRSLYLEKLQKLKFQSPPPALIVYVVPLLFESRYAYPELDAIVVVSADKAQSIERIMNRDHTSRDQAEKRYNSQLPMEVKERKADIVIRNDGSIEDLKTKVRKSYAELLKRKPSGREE